jgi:hypothetical protein
VSANLDLYAAMKPWQRQQYANYKKRENIAPTLEQLYHDHIFREKMKIKEAEMEHQTLEHNTTA